MHNVAFHRVSSLDTPADLLDAVVRLLQLLAELL
jgi:hypothetical protein